MKCVIPGANVKVFGRAIHSLSKIGEELYIEPLEHGLALRTVNSSRSAYACFLFAPAFFIHYVDGSSDVDSEDSADGALKCKIAIRSCLTVFKSLSTLEKTVDKCKIRLDMEEARLVFQLYCRHGIVKTFNLTFIECETLQAVFSKDVCPNVLTAQTRLLCDAVTNFQNTQEEVSLIVSPEKACFKNYVEDEPDPKKVIHTSLNLDCDEFESYQVSSDTEVTFCLKELRAILGFSEAANLPIGIHFESAGKPIVFSMETDPSFEAHFVLATLADKNSPTPSQLSQQLPVPAQQRSSTTTFTRPAPVRPHSTTNATVSTKSQPAPAVASTSQAKINCKSKSRSSAVSEKLQNTYKELMDDEPPDNPTHFTSQPKNNAQLSLKPPKKNGISQDRGDTSTKPTNGKAANRKTTENRVDPTEDEDDNSPVLPVITSKLQKTNVCNKSTVHVDTSMQDLDPDDEEDEDDLVPGTPPSKKFKSMFFGLSQATCPSQPEKPSVILAEDSEDDD